MDDQVKKIAALIGHQQQQEARVTALIEAFEKESALLRVENAKLASAILSLSQATGDVTDTVRQSVNRAIQQVSEEVKFTALEQQKPAISSLTQVVNDARASVKLIHRDASWFNWKSLIWTTLVGAALLGCCFVGITYYLNDGYQRIEDMQSMNKQWERKAPLANISTCDGEPCVQVKGDKYTNRNGDVFYQVKPLK